MYVESGDALRTWKFLDFNLQRHRNIAILASRTALKHQWKSSRAFLNPRKHHYSNSFILKGKETAVRRQHAIEPINCFFFFVGWKCKYLMKMLFFWFKSVHAPPYAHQVLAQVLVLLFQMERGTLIYYTWQVITWYMPVTKTYPSTFITNLLLLKESGAQTWEFTFFLILSFLLSIRETYESKK